ncbi:MAG: methyltransferase domain-containing protein [Saccharospirillum sp.]|uniref:putative RNA methyltransferase n=1 Tax=Saccharospirillum sp. TaxID=2033801 RepID=UPI0034A08E27
MPVTAFDRLACPLDGQPLTRQLHAWQCPQGHSFDIARQGYVHLLPVQQKRSKDPGDSKAMVAARQRFLNAGYYQCIADALNEAVLPEMASGAACLDAGCGEGYYLRQLGQAVPEGIDMQVIGLDVSKWAVLSAAKQDPAPSWVVGTNAHIPVPDSSLDRVLCVFGFPVYDEFARILGPAGRLVMVDPGPDHLRELRDIIYPSITERPAGARAVPESFQVVNRETVCETIVLEDASSIEDLLAMTPHLYRAPAEGLARAAELTRLQLTLDVRIQVLELTEQT